MSKTKKRTACVVTCYRQPDYVRAVALYDGMKNCGMFDEVIWIRNSSPGIARYWQVFSQLIKIRFSKNPDTYLLTFRAYETLPFIMLLTAGKQIIYDEFVNPVEWFVYEHNKLHLGFLWKVILRPAYRFLGKRVSYILADTPSHAQYSANLMNLPIDKYRSIPVSTDESMFKPAKSTATGQPFKVLYIGNMLPLYGVDYVIDAAVQLADNPSIEFTIAGSEAVATKVDEARKHGAHIERLGWIPYKDFPALFHSCDLLLGGPFGKTVQSQFVISGKTFQFLASGLPVVVGENKEAYEFTDKHDSIIVPEADSQKLREAIEWAASHKNALATIGKNGRKLYEKKFSSKRVADDLCQLFARQ